MGAIHPGISCPTVPSLVTTKASTEISTSTASNALDKLATNSWGKKWEGGCGVGVGNILGVFFLGGILGKIQISLFPKMVGITELAEMMAENPAPFWGNREYQGFFRGFLYVSQLNLGFSWNPLFEWSLECLSRYPKQVCFRRPRFVGIWGPTWTRGTSLLFNTTLSAVWTVAVVLMMRLYPPRSESISYLGKRKIIFKSAFLGWIC